MNDAVNEATNEVLLEFPVEGVALLKINRPAVKNALNAAVREQLSSLFQKLGQESGVRVIVLTGGDVFAAGADLRDLADRTAIEMMMRNTHLLWESISRCAKPVIAAVKGYAWGGGCELAMHADIIIAGESASFCQPEIKVGIMPGAGGTQRLTRAVGKFRALKMLLTGQAISAREALEMGLVSEVVADDRVLDVALETAKRVALMPPLAVRLIKEAVLMAEDAPLEVGLALERKSFQLLFDSRDQKEGMHAFLEKRPAVFEGK